jgi:hypothetical protein
MGIEGLRFLGQSRSIGTPMQTQGELNFEASGNSGVASWLAVRNLTAKELAQRLQLPLGRQVEVWLQGGVMLRGMLSLKESLLFVPEGSARHLVLRIGHADFTYREIESCVALD